MKYLLGCYEKSMPASLSFKEKLETVKKAGFDYMEMSVDETPLKQKRLDYTKEECLELKRLTVETDCPIKTMCLSAHRAFPLGSEKEEDGKKSLEIMEKAIILAGNLGIRIIQIAGYDAYYTPSTKTTRKLFEKRLAECVEIASEYGVILAFETMETEFMNTIAKAMKHVSRVNSPFLQVYPDLGNITNACLTYKTSVLDDILSGEGHIVATHLKETTPGIFREVEFSKGHVDFKNDISLLQSLGVNLFNAEFWCTKDMEKDNIYFEKMISANNFLRSFFK